MGYYHSCSPYDVQARNGGRFTFESIAKKYEDTKPLRGKRKAENIRPIGQRDRAWERMIKVSDTEYYVSFDCYSYRTHHNRGITWKLENGMEYMTVHTPKKTWNGANNEINPRALSSSSTYWFYDFNLPHEFSMANYRANKYVRYQDKYYTIERGDITFQRKQGGSPTDWQPLVVHREFKRTLDRKKAKELRELTKSFLPYYDVMSELVEPTWQYGNPIYMAIVGKEHRDITADEVLGLFKQDEVPDQWLGMVEHYKRRIREWNYDYVNRTSTEVYRRDKLHEIVSQDLFALVKPCKQEAVELGKLTHDRYKRWF